MKLDNSQVDLPRYVTLGLCTSLMLHAVFVWFLQKQIPVVKAPSEAIDVQFIAPPKRQIVDPVEAAKPEAPLNTNRLSERNSKVEQESIKRGAPDAGKVVGRSKAVPPVEAPPVKSAPPQGGAPQKQREPLRNLVLPTDEAVRSFGSTKAPEQPVSTAGDSYEPFSRPAGSGAAFLGLRGSADFLPSLPDGDITMLNAKADQYAVFVRRVAVRVFRELRQLGWETLSRSEILALQEMNTVRAVLSKKGEQQAVQLEGSSGSPTFDRILVNAVTRAANDPNPPPGAEATDGRIHFIFRARSWSRLGVAPRSGAPIERRWLLLATGLD